MRCQQTSFFFSRRHAHSHSLCVFTLFLFCMPALATALCETPLRVNTGEWPPYQFHLANGDAGGLDVDAVKRMARGVGCRLQFTRVPAERAHPMLEKGEIDILMAASDLPARRQYAWFSVAYRHEEMAVLAPADSEHRDRDFTALLAGKASLLAPRFGWYGAGYDAARPALIARARLQFYDDYAQGIAMLAARRADLVLGDEQALRHTAAQRKLSLRRLFLTNSSPVHLMFSKARFSEADVARFNAALAATAAPAGNR